MTKILSIDDHNQYILEKAKYIEIYKCLDTSDIKEDCSLSFSVRFDSTSQSTFFESKHKHHNYFHLSQWYRTSDYVNEYLVQKFVNVCKNVYGKTQGFGSRNISPCTDMNIYIQVPEECNV